MSLHRSTTNAFKIIVARRSLFDKKKKNGIKYTTNVGWFETVDETISFQIIKWRQYLIVDPSSSLADPSQRIGKKQIRDIFLFGLLAGSFKKLLYPI